MDLLGSQSVSFQVAKDVFSESVAWVARNLPTKAVQPVMRAMVISADTQGLELAGFDYEISTRVRIPAEVSEEGTIAVAGKLIAEIVGSLANKPIEIHVKDSTMHLSSGSSRFELPLIPLDDYPQFPSLPEATGEVDAALFVESVTQVAAAAGKDDTLPMLTGINMAIENSRIILTATDRYRLAQRTLEWSPQQKSIKAELLIPAKSLVENARTMDTSGAQPVSINVGAAKNIGGEGLFGLKVGDRETTTRMLDAEFPNVKPLLPREHTSIASVEIAPLQEALRRVSLVTERNSQIRLEFSSGSLVLSAGGTEESGHAEETVEAAFSGAASLMIAFNPSYLKEGLSVIHTDRVFFGFTEPSRPAILIPQPEQLPEADADGKFPTPETEFTYLLMPVRLPG